MASLNGVTIYPSDIQETSTRIGIPIQAANGNRRYAHRAFKRTWRLQWDLIPDAERDGIRTIAETSGTFAFVNEEGTSFTVYVPEGGYDSSVGVVGSTLYYNVSLTVEQA